MNNRTKIILTAIGLSAILIPVGLLFFLTSKVSDQSSNLQNGPRQIDKNAVTDAVRSNQKQVYLPTPSPSSPSASPSQEGSRSAN